MLAPDLTDEQDDEVEEILRELGRTGKQPLRWVFARRALRAVAHLSRRMEEPSLQEAVSAPSDYGVLLTALEAEPGLSLLTRDDPLAGARLRGTCPARRCTVTTPPIRFVERAAIAGMFS